MSQKEQRAVTIRVLDTATRHRRQRQQLEKLEQDNFHEEPHANFEVDKKAPKFQELDEKGKKGTDQPVPKKKKTRTTEYYKLKYRKPINQLIEEEALENSNGPNYLTAAAPPSKLPPRSFCSVCGFPSPYNCTLCGGKYCSLKCLTTHRETRCQKHTM